MPCSVEFACPHWTKEKYIHIATAVFTLGMSIASFLSTLEGLSVLQAAESSFLNQVSLWKRTPLTDLQWIPTNLSCPDGYSTPTASNALTAQNDDFIIGEFPGIHVQNYNIYNRCFDEFFLKKKKINQISYFNLIFTV